jgi:acylphosphatase
MSKTARRFIVHGRVQGVGFRWFVQRQASSLGLTGYVKNLADGGVEVRAAGERKQIDTLRDHLREGPIGSAVTSVDETDAPAESWRKFEIAY